MGVGLKPQHACSSSSVWLHCRPAVLRNPTHVLNAPRATVCNLSVCCAALQVGLWILWSTWQLFDCYRKNLLAQHPMFAFTANQTAAAMHMATQPAAAPAQPVNPFAYGGTPGSYQPPVVQGYPAAQQYPAGAGRV